MPVVRKSTATLVAGTPQVIDLGVFDRFGGRGGSVSVVGTCTAAGTGVVTMDVQVGSDMVAQDVLLGVENIAAGAGVGPDAQTQPVISAVGAPGDPIQITLKGSAGTATVQANITNL